MFTRAARMRSPAAGGLVVGVHVAAEGWMDILVPAAPNLRTHGEQGIPARSAGSTTAVSPETTLRAEEPVWGDLTAEEAVACVAAGTVAAGAGDSLRQGEQS